MINLHDIGDDISDELKLIAIAYRSVWTHGTLRYNSKTGRFTTRVGLKYDGWGTYWLKYAREQGMNVNSFKPEMVQVI